MRSVPCPRCKTSVPIGKDGSLVCPGCGLRGARNPGAGPASPKTATPRAAQPLRPGQAGAPPPGLRPAARPAAAGAAGAAPARSKAPLAIGIAVGALLLVGGAVAAYFLLDQDDGKPAASAAGGGSGQDAGGSGSSSASLADLSAAERNALATAAIRDFNDPDAPEPPGLRKVTMEGSSTDEEVGTGTMSLAFENGTAGVQKVTVSASDGSVSFTFSYYCSPTRQVTVAGGEAYEGRAPLGGDCANAPGPFGFEEEEAEGDEDAFDALLTDMEQVNSLTAQVDGDALAVAYTGRNGLPVTARVDAEGRLLEIQASRDGVSVAWGFEYGAKQAIAVPTQFAGRVPAQVVYEPDFGALGDTWEIGDSEQPPRSEISIQVIDLNDEEAAPLASFPASQSAGTAGAFAFTYLDADADGTVSAGDSFTVTGLTSDHDVILYDTWADGEVNDTPIPGPGLVLALLALAGVALLRRRA